MRKQFAVFGLGSFGMSVAITLQQLGCEVIAVDHDKERVKDVADHVSFAMRADIGDPDVIRSLEPRNLDGIIIAAADNMEASIMATLSAKEINIPYVLCKARDDMHAQVLKKIGADAIVFPEEEMGKKVAKSLVSVNLTDWIALSPDYSILETAIPKSWVGKTLKELDVRKKYNVNVAGLKEGEKVEINPDPDMPLREDMILVLIGEDKSLENI
ncbi:MAG: potassium channel family protein [Lachnospiraceae bacterium]